MTDITLEKRRLHGGIWEAVLSLPEDSSGIPRIEVTHLDTAVEGVSLTEVPGAPNAWLLRVPVPPAALSDGVQTFLVRDTDDDARLGSFTIVTGQPLEDDLRAEIGLLRAELDMLKRAFRRHCLETGGSD